MGSATLEPAGEFEAGSFASFTLTYTAGYFGIDDTGSIKVVHRFASDTGRPQFGDPAGWNFTTVEASNGAEAVAKYGNRAHELLVVVTDMRMPDMGGAELARVLRLRAPNLPFVFVSGFNEELDDVHDGVDVLLEKPFSRDALLGAIEKVKGREEVRG